MSLIHKILSGILISAVLLEVAVLLGTGLVRWRSGQDAIKLGTALPPIKGYPLRYRNGLFTAGDGCVVYRLVSKTCAACKVEEPLWRHTTTAETAAKCQVVVLMPDLLAAPFYPAQAPVPQILWMSLDWARSIKLVMTPTTIATYHGRIIWANQGELDVRHFASLQTRLAQLPGG